MSTVHGRALFVRRWGIIPGGEDMRAAEWARAYRNLGFEWAVISTAWGDTTDMNRSVDHWRALADEGITAHAMWGLPTPMRSEDALMRRADAVLAFSARVGARSTMLDPERGWRSERERARAFARKMANAGRYSFTSYGAPAGQPGFPFREFLAGTTLVVPQTYDGDMRFSASYGAQAIEDYRDRGAPPDAAFALGVGTWVRARDGREGRPKTLDELRRHLALTPSMAVIAWPYGTLSAAMLDVLAHAPLGVGATGPRRAARRDAGGNALPWILGSLLAMLVGKDKRT